MKDSLVFELVFLDGEGKQRRLTISQPAEGIDAQTAQEVMAVIVECDLFKDEKGMDLYVTPVAARYISRDVTEVFSAEL